MVARRGKCRYAKEPPSSPSGCNVSPELDVARSRKAAELRLTARKESSLPRSAPSIIKQQIDTTSRTLGRCCEDVKRHQSIAEGRHPLSRTCHGSVRCLALRALGRGKMSVIGSRPGLTAAGRVPKAENC
jgi:hypothetical protein